MSDFVQQLAAIQQRAAQHEAAQIAATRADLEALGAEAVQFMVQHHPWQNRTYAAERGLASQPLHPPALRDGGRIALVGRAPHQKYLELAHGSRFSIIQPTAAMFAANFVARLRRRWR